VDVVVLEVVVHVDEDVVVQESEQERTGTLPKNLIARLSRAGSLGRRGSEATAHASRVRAKLALGKAESSHGHGLDSRLDTTRHDSPRPRPWPGTARRASARGTPSPFTNFTSGPLLVHPLSWLRFSLTFNAGLNP
jgi:hypothetical protein